MTAGELVRTTAALVGRRVVTPAMGDYPGGEATIVELAPDPNAPEIVFTVRHPQWGEIGVFAYEEVTLLGTADPEVRGG